MTRPPAAPAVFSWCQNPADEVHKIAGTHSGARALFPGLDEWSLIPVVAAPSITGM